MNQLKTGKAKLWGALAAMVTPLALSLAPVHEAGAHGALKFPPSLQDVRPAAVPGINKIIKDKKAALVLGKALFWDMNVGSDDMACGSCHFHAGADNRTKNALNHGGKRDVTDASGNPPYPSLPPGHKGTASGGTGGPNYEVKAADFPFVQFANPKDNGSAKTAESDNVMSSSGTYAGEFKGVSKTGPSTDDCDRAGHDDLYHVGDLRSRQVEPRNTPTVFNSVLNYRLFWDGRANNTFNGVNEFGLRDGEAGVWINTGGKVKKQKLALSHAHVASLAVGPPLNNQEMSCNGRKFPDVGRKLLSRRALERQEVHAEDSVLAKYRAADGIGLKQTYAQLVKKAFNAKYWSAKAPKGGKAPFGKPGYSDEAYTQMEANFSMFFGLAMQEYFNTLIADQAPIDSKRVQICFDGTSIQPVSTCPSNDQLIEAPQEMSAAQLRGMQNFINAHCVLCHSGALFSAAESPENLTVTRNKKGKVKLQAPDPSTVNTVLRTTDLTGRPRLQDVGFMNTGVAHWSFDQGIGRPSALHPELNQPLSFARQYLSELIGDSSGVLDPLKAKACRLGVAFAGGRADPMAFPKDQLQSDPSGSDGCVVTDYHNGSVTDKTSLAFIPTQEAAQAEWNKTLNGQPSLLKVGVSAAFKIPSLRNVELTAPYFHNGSVLTLRQVFEFYNRTGNYTNPDRAAGEMPTLSEIIGESPTAIDDLVEFLKSLTDERVRNEAAPFDHPALKVPHGHKGDEAIALDEDGDGMADDEILSVPAIGRNGRTAEGLEPIKPLQQTIEGGDGTL